MKLGSFRELCKGILVGAFFLTSSLPATAEVSSYRYALTTSTCSNVYGRYLYAVSPSAQYRHEVETDSTNRIVRITHYRRGRAFLETRYTAFDSANLPIATVTLEGGVPTKKESIERDAAGCAVGGIEYTMSGDRTGSSTLVYSSEYNEERSFSAEDKPLEITRSYFNADGLLIRVVEYFNALDLSRWFDYTYDPSTGLASERRQYADYGRNMQVRKLFQYDSNDVLVHSDSVGRNGRLFASQDFEDGGLIKDFYSFDNGDTRIVNFSNDPEGRIKAAQQFDDGVLRCSFVIERLADNTIKDTIVRAADGTILAEYPGHVVSDCNARGTNSGNFQGTIFKAPPWW